MSTAAVVDVDYCQRLFGVCPSAECVDYLSSKQQFQLHSLLTEQPHAATLTLSQTVQQHVDEGLKQLFTVDQDISNMLNELTQAPARLLVVSRLISSFVRCLSIGGRIYVYGCGATGRLAKLMESGFWRKFWDKIKRNQQIWSLLSDSVSASITDSLVGEMTGGDRALIASLEGFEDLPLVGALQLGQHRIERGDVVVAVTEGGETSSVIGTILAAQKLWTHTPQGNERDACTLSEEEIRSHLFFVYNNPDSVLLPFTRSASVLNSPFISKLNLSTGPQAITGSTRMQATSSETYVIACALHCALHEFLSRKLQPQQLESIGFTSSPIPINHKLIEFQQHVLTPCQQAVEQLKTFTEWEASTYDSHHFTTYFGMDGLMSVFIDNTERSPTFRLFALDPVTLPTRKCWLQVWSAADTREAAWLKLLGRPFQGMETQLYLQPFQTLIADPYLKQTALNSLPNAATSQKDLYDFSFSAFNIARAGPKSGDLGVLVLMNEEEQHLFDVQSHVFKYVQLFTSVPDARVAILIATSACTSTLRASLLSHFASHSLDVTRICLVLVSVDSTHDPLHIRAQLVLKMILNAHSTAIMAKLNKVLGNAMINVSPSNLKLIGRATYLIQTHVNRAIQNCKRQFSPVSYQLVNAILYDSIAFLKEQQAKLEAVHGNVSVSSVVGGTSAEVSLSIIRILSCVEQNAPVSAQQCATILNDMGLEKFLQQFQIKNS